MSRVSKLISLAACALLAASCGSEENVANKADIAGTVAGAASSEIVIGMLDMNQLVILDTVMTDDAGNFRYELEVKKGDPEFVYVYNEGKKISSLLLDAGDAVSVTVDADGNASVEGSEESVKLMQVEREHAEQSAVFAELSSSVESASKSQVSAISRKMAEEYRKYNRNSVKYIMENCHSLTVIPVLYRRLGENLPVFNEVSDAVLFASVADSLATVYPESRYVKSLKAEADFRYQQLELQHRVNSADVIGYPDVELPGLDGQMKKLSDMDAKVILLYFWTASNAGQNNFNVDVLKKIYQKYHDKGFDIYQVSLDADKVMWATTLMGQDLPWTNVCDSRGVTSPYIAQYNLQVIPAAYVIHNGELVDGDIVDEASFRKLLDKLLK